MFCWDSRLSLRAMDQKIKFGWTIGYGDSYLEFLIRHFKVFRRHAILYDAAGAVRAHSSKGPGYRYKIGRGSNSCLLGHVTGLLFCFYVKFFLPSIFNSVDSWNSMFLIVQDKELTEKNIIKELGLYIDGSLQGFPFVHQRLVNLKNRQHGRQVIYMEMREVVESWIMIISLLSFCDIKVMNAEVFAKGLEKCRLLTRLLGQNVENLDDYGCPKIQDIVKTDSLWICSSYPFRHKTSLHCAERKAKVYGEWALQLLKTSVRV